MILVVTASRVGEPAPSRRRFLKGSIVLGGLALVGSAVAFFRTRGYALPSGHAKLVSLDVWQFVVTEHLARRIAAPDREGDASIPTPDDVGVADFVDRYVARMSASVRGDLLRFFAYVEHVAPVGAGFASRFTRLGPGDQDKVLASLEASDNPVLRGGFAQVKSLLFLGYYRDVRTWKILGYDGPLVRR